MPRQQCNLQWLEFDRLVESSPLFLGKIKQQYILQWLEFDILEESPPSSGKGNRSKPVCFMQWLVFDRQTQARCSSPVDRIHHNQRKGKLCFDE